MGLKVVAYADPSDPDLHGINAREKRESRKEISNDWRSVSYSNATELRQALQDLVQKNKDCLEILEIDAHGNATNCNGISFWNMADWAKELNKVEWCADSHIFLSACITGCKDPIFEGPGIAQSLSTLIPDDPKVRTSTICGAKGYATGTYAAGNIEVTKTCTLETADGHKEKQPTPPDSEDAKKDDAWRCFREGAPI